MALTDPVPTPPYPDLRRALEAFEELVDIVSGLVPVAIDDAADLGYEPIDAGELAFSESDDSDRSGGHLSSRNRARRRFTRLLLSRLLADDDIVLFPVPQTDASTALAEYPDLRTWGDVPVRRHVVLTASLFNQLCAEVQQHLDEAGIPLLLSTTVDGANVTDFDFVPRGASPAAGS